MGNNMDIKNIKRQSNQIYLKYRKQIIPEFFFIGYVSLLAQYLQSGLFSFFVSLFLCPIGHGYVKCSMKMVDEDNAIINYQDSMIGIIDFVRVAPAYLMRKAVILLATMICGLPILFYVKANVSSISLEWLSSLGNAFIQTEFLLPNFETSLHLFENIVILLDFTLCIVVYLFLNGLLAPVPYIMEQEEFSWSESLLYSIELMHGHMLSLFQLYLQYFLRYAFYGIAVGLIIMLVGRLNEILMLFCMVFSLIFYIEVFKGRVEIAKYLFYKEIRGDKNEESIDN